MSKEDFYEVNWRVKNGVWVKKASKIYQNE